MFKKKTFPSLIRHSDGHVGRILNVIVSGTRLDFFYESPLFSDRNLMYSINYSYDRDSNCYDTYSAPDNTICSRFVVRGHSNDSNVLTRTIIPYTIYRIARRLADIGLAIYPSLIYRVSGTLLATAIMITRLSK